MAEKFRRSQSQTLPVPASTQDAVHSLYASDKTLSDIGWLAERLPQIAKADIILISPEDLKNGSSQELKNLFKQKIPSDVYMRLEKEWTPQQWDDFAQATRKGPSAASFDFNNDGKNDIAIIVTGNPERTPEQFFSDLTNISASELKNTPGTAFDYLAVTLYHEAAHVTQPVLNSAYATMPLPYEIDADRKGMMAYLEDVKNGYPLNPDVMDAVIDARIGSTLANKGGILEHISCTLRDLSQSCRLPSHTTHIGLIEHQPSDGLPTPLNASTEELQGMLHVKSVVNLFQGQFYIISAIEGYAKEGKMTADSKRHFTNEIDMITKLKYPLAASEIGQDIATQDPMGSKAIIDRLDNVGFFNNIPGATNYLDRVHNFFNKYTPDYMLDPSYKKMEAAMNQISDSFIQENAPKDTKSPATPSPLLKQELVTP